MRGYINHYFMIPIALSSKPNTTINAFLYGLYNISMRDFVIIIAFILCFIVKLTTFYMHALPHHIAAIKVWWVNIINNTMSNIIYCFKLPTLWKILNINFPILNIIFQWLNNRQSAFEYGTIPAPSFLSPWCMPIHY